MTGLDIVAPLLAVRLPRGESTLTVSQICWNVPHFNSGLYALLIRAKADVLSPGEGARGKKQIEKIAMVVPVAKASRVSRKKLIRGSCPPLRYAAGDAAKGGCCKTLAF